MVGLIDQSPGLLMAVILLLPWVGACACYGARQRAFWVALSVSVLVLIMVLALFSTVSLRPVYREFPGVLGLGLILGVDYLDWGLASLGAWLWLGICLLSPHALEHLRHSRRFYAALLMTLGAVMGVFFSGDLFTLFLFFEIMALSSYVLIIHHGSPRALAAGNTYLYLSIAGGLCLLFGLFTLYAVTGHTSWEPVLDQLVAQGIPPAYVAAPLLVGFGVKAGIMPLHLWMVQVYPAMSFMVCALSSGILIKTGVYGILRTTMAFTSHGGEGVFTGWGVVLLVLGMTSVLVGAVMASWQRNVRSLLAYSSISQVGYLLVGLGAFTLLGQESGLALGASVLHLVNHSLFKAGLFLALGVILTRTVRWPKYSHLMAVFMAGGLAGLPLFNGFVSKNLLHKAMGALHYEFPSFWTILLDQAFFLGSALTIVYVLRLFVVLLPQRDLPVVKPPLSFWPAGLYLAVLGGGLVALGSFPHGILQLWVAPVVTESGLALPGLEGVSFYDRGAFIKTGGTLLLGGALFVLGQRGLWAKPGKDYRLTERAVDYSLHIMSTAVVWMGRILDDGINWLYGKLAVGLVFLMERTAGMERALGGGYDSMGKGSREALERVLGFENSLGNAYERLGETAREMTEKTAKLDGHRDKSYDAWANESGGDSPRTSRSWGEQSPTGTETKPSPPHFNPFSFTISVLVVALMLTGLLLVFLIYGLGGW